MVWIAGTTPPLTITLHPHTQQTFLPSGNIIRKMHENDMNNGESTLAIVELRVEMGTTVEPRAGFINCGYQLYIKFVMPLSSKSF